MALGEEKQEVGEIRVGDGITGRNKEEAQLVAGGQGQAQAANVLGLLSKGPGLGPIRRRRPADQSLVAALAQFPQEMGQQVACPRQGLSDPAVQLPGVGKAP